ncbi:MAG: polysaccharide deacetylase family protein, partial [Thermoplasmata archaeon]|nr:polysaccharide deacetylase family protein [Thermoplasmata archaeon]
INVGNSITFNYTGMDVLYEAIGKNGESALGQCFGLDFTNAEDDIIGKLKERIIAISPDEFSQIRNCLRLETKRLSALFLNSSEIRELAQLATIASHGMTHRDLTNHPEISQQEIRQSKRILEELVGREIQIFSYPEGRCNPQIQQFCKDAGYVYSLSISHQQDNPYCIGRFCITNHRKEIMRRLHE